MNELETQVLQLIGENVSDPDVFTDGSDQFQMIRDSLNDAIQELCMVTGSYTRTYFLTLQANQTFYRIAAQQDYFGYIVEAWDRHAHRKLEQIDCITMAKEDPWFLKRPGGTSPVYYSHIGEDFIGVFPYASAGGVVLELRCVMIPHVYANDSDQIKVRQQFQRACVYDAVSKFFASRGNAERASSWLSEYLELSKMDQLHPEQADRVFQLGGQRDNYPYRQVATI